MKKERFSTSLPAKSTQKHKKREFEGDYFKAGMIPEAVLTSTVESLVIGFSMLEVTSVVGALIGGASPSALVGSIFLIYGENIFPL